MGREVANPQARNATENPYSVSTAGIVKDLTDERPPWIFSAYGPGRDAPGQLFGGQQTEQSFEELRLHHWKALAAGNPQAAVRVFIPGFVAYELHSCTGSADFLRGRSMTSIHFISRSSVRWRMQSKPLPKQCDLSWRPRSNTQTD